MVGDFERDARRVRVKFTKSISRVSWPRRNATSYQPSFFHNYLTLIALYKLKSKEEQKRKQLYKHGLAQEESTSDCEKLYRSRLSAKLQLHCWLSDSKSLNTKENGMMENSALCRFILFLKILSHGHPYVS